MCVCDVAMAERDGAVGGMSMIMLVNCSKHVVLRNLIGGRSWMFNSHECMHIVGKCEVLHAYVVLSHACGTDTEDRRTGATWRETCKHAYNEHYACTIA